MIQLPRSTEEEILDILEQSDVSLTPEEVADKARVHEASARRFLKLLEARGLVTRREAGCVFYAARVGCAQ